MENEIVEALFKSNLVTGIAATCSAIVAFCAVVLSWKTARRAIDAKRADVHSRFQSEIRSIQQKFTQAVNDPNNWNPTPEEKRYIRMYWYAVFDEWLVCHKEDRSLLDLWNKYYKNGVISALKNYHFVEDVKILFEGESAFFGHRAEFKEEINKLYGINNNGKSLIIS